MSWIKKSSTNSKIIFSNTFSSMSRNNIQPENQGSCGSIELLHRRSGLSKGTLLFKVTMELSNPMPRELLATITL